MAPKDHGSGLAAQLTFIPYLRRRHVTASSQVVMRGKDKRSWAALMPPPPKKNLLKTGMLHKMCTSEKMKTVLFTDVSTSTMPQFGRQQHHGFSTQIKRKIATYTWRCDMALLFSILKSDSWPQYECKFWTHANEASTQTCTNTHSTAHKSSSCKCRKQCSSVLEIIIGVTKTGWQNNKK